MKKVYEFDPVLDSQQVFRRIMEAFSNPGRLGSIGEYADRLAGQCRELLAIGVTLLDNEVSFSTCGNKELSEDILSTTLSREKEITQADYIFIPRDQMEKSIDVIECAKCATLKDPHQSATAIIGLEDLRGIPNARVSGPGVNGYEDIYMMRHMKRIIQTRDNMSYEYPTGIDLLFVDDQGNVMAIPRKIKVEEFD